jgi:hypothetical protein
MKKIITLLIAVAIIFPVTAQYTGQALRFSQTYPTMTARSMSMGGAFATLGGDLSSAYLNPAGLGVYRKSELTFSPGFVDATSSADYFNQTMNDSRFSMIIGNFGYVSAFNSKKESGFVGLAFAISYNRLNDFNGNIAIKGENPFNSLADYFMDRANGKHPDNLEPFVERLAFDTYIIDTTPGSAYNYETPVFLPVDQRKTIETKGRSGEWSFALGMNLSNVFYFGMSFDILPMHYEETLMHSEYDITNYNDFSSFRYTETLDLTGSGFNFKLGFIARPVKFLRLGGALHIPTIYYIKEVYDANMKSYFDNGDYYNAQPTYQNGDPIEAGTYKYYLVTPLRALGGVSFQIGKIALLATDVEYVDYNSMRYRNYDASDDITSYNDEIRDTYRPVLNIKGGGELRFGPMSVRAGAGYYPSPYKKGELNENAGSFEITSGVGYRDNNFFFDMGFSALLHNEKYNLYYDNIANLILNRYSLITTVGFRF